MLVPKLGSLTTSHGIFCRVIEAVRDGYPGFVVRTGGRRYDLRTRDKNWLKVIEMFLDDFSAQWQHPKPPGLRMTTAMLSNGLVAYVLQLDLC